MVTMNLSQNKSKRQTPQIFNTGPFKIKRIKMHSFFFSSFSSKSGAYITHNAANSSDIKTEKSITSNFRFMYCRASVPVIKIKCIATGGGWLTFPVMFQHFSHCISKMFCHQIGESHRLPDIFMNVWIVLCHIQTLLVLQLCLIYVCLLCQCQYSCNYKSYSAVKCAVNLPLVWRRQSCWAWQWCKAFPHWSQNGDHPPLSSYRAKTCGNGRLFSELCRPPKVHDPCTGEESLMVQKLTIN